MRRVRPLLGAIKELLVAPWWGKRLIVEATVEVVRALWVVRRADYGVAAARLGSRLPKLPAVGRGERPTIPEPVGASHARDADRVGRAVRRAAHLLAGPDTCFSQAIAASTMLRRRGIPTVALVGVRREQADDADGLESHAWLWGAGRIVTGADVADTFEPLVAYSPAD